MGISKMQGFESKPIPLNQTIVDYKIVIVLVNTTADYEKVAMKVNKLISQGYQPYGSLVVDHSSGHTDVAQAMVKVAA